MPVYSSLLGKVHCRLKPGHMKIPSDFPGNIQPKTQNPKRKTQIGQSSAGIAVEIMVPQHPPIILDSSTAVIQHNFHQTILHAKSYSSGETQSQKSPPMSPRRACMYIEEIVKSNVMQQRI